MTDIVKRLAENSKRAESPIDALAMDDAKAEITRLRAKVAKADALAEQVQRVKDFRYDPNTGIELNRLEEELAAYREADT